MFENYLDILKSAPKTNKRAISKNYHGDATQQSIIEIAQRGSQSALDAILEFEREWRLNYLDDPFWDQFDQTDRIHPVSACLMAFDKGSYFADLKQFLFYLNIYCLRDGVPAGFSNETFLHEDGIPCVLGNVSTICREQVFPTEEPYFNALMEWRPTNTYLILSLFMTVTNESGLYNFLGYIKGWSVDDLKPSALKLHFPSDLRQRLEKFYSFSSQDELNEKERIEEKSLNETLKIWWALGEAVGNLRIFGPHNEKTMSIVAYHVYGRLLAVSSYVYDALKTYQNRSPTSHLYFDCSSEGIADLCGQIERAVDNAFTHMEAMVASSKHKYEIKRYEKFHRETVLVTTTLRHESFYQFFEPVES